MGHADMSTTGDQAGPTPLVVMCEEHGKPDTPPATAGRPQGRLRAWRVRERGESERRSGNRADTGCDITRRESEPTSARSSMAREPEKPRSGGRQMAASARMAKASDADAGAPPANETTWDQINWSRVVEEITRLQVRIAKATQAGRGNKVHALQRLLTRSRSGKLLAVKRVTENTGKRTAGVDGVLWSTPASKLNAAQSLTHRGYQPLPLRRLYIPMDRVVLRKWLHGGFVDNGVLFPTEAGTPQGGIASPVLANLALDGLEDAVASAVGRNATARKWAKAHVVRYADDFIVTGLSREMLEQQVKPAVKAFLAVRGLQLAPDKTLITHIARGFDFLGQNVRKYGDKLLIRPPRKSVKPLVDKVRDVLGRNKAAEQANVILQLNPILRGWAMYHRHVVAAATFLQIDHLVWSQVWRWAKRRHP